MLSSVDLRPELLARQARVRSAAERAGLVGVIALGRAFYDRPGPCAWLTGHHPPFLAAAPQPGLRGAGHAVLVLPVRGTTTLVCDPTGTREELVACDDVRSTDDVWDGLEHALRGHGLVRGPVGVAGYDLLPAPVAAALGRDLPGLELRSFDRELDELRQVKSASEQALLAAAAACCRRGARPRGRAAARGIERARGRSGGHRRGAARGRRSRALPARPLRPVERAHRALAAGARPCPGGGRAGDGRRDRRTRGLRVRCRPHDPARRGHALPGARCSMRVARPPMRARAPAVPERRWRTCSTRRGPSTSSAGLAAHARAFAGHGIGTETVEAPLLSAASAELVLVQGMALCVEPGVSVAGRRRSPHRARADRRRGRAPAPVRDANAHLNGAFRSIPVGAHAVRTGDHGSSHCHHTRGARGCLRARARGRDRLPDRRPDAEIAALRRLEATAREPARRRPARATRAALHGVRARPQRSRRARGRARGRRRPGPRAPTRAARRGGARRRARRRAACVAREHRRARASPCRQPARPAAPRPERAARAAARRSGLRGAAGRGPRDRDARHARGRPRADPRARRRRERSRPPRRAARTSLRRARARARARQTPSSCPRVR